MTPPNPPTPPGTDRAQAIRTRCEKATAGPWVCSYRGDGSGSVYTADDEGGSALLDDDHSPFLRGELRYEDGVFAAHAREDVPWLLDQLRAAQSWKEDAQAFMRAVGVKLLNAGYEDDSLIDGVQWVCDQLRAAQEEADKLRMFLGDASPKSNALRQRVDAERAADKARIAELEAALQARASSGATTERIGGHIYDSDNTSDCHNGCGCWMGPSSSGGPNGLDPFGDCPKSAPPVATTGGETDYAAIARHVEAVQTNFSATLRQTGSNGDDAPDDYCVLSSAIVALRRAAKSAPVATTGPTLADVLAVVQRWHDVYPLDVFPADGESRDCHSAAMGRHMSLRLQEEIRKLWIEAETAAMTGPDEPTLEQDLASALNRHSAENGSNTPDFILAEYLLICLSAFNQASRSRERWYGQSLSIGGQTPPQDAPTRG